MAELGTCPISNVKGIGAACANGNPLFMPYLAVVATPGTQFDTYADFIDEATVLGKIASGELFPLSYFINLEDTSTEKSTVETASGDIFTTRDGKTGFMGEMNLSLKQNELFQDYGSVGWTLFLVGENGTWEGQTPDGTVVKGYTLAEFNPEPMKRALSADAKSSTAVTIRFAENDELNKNIVVAESADLDWSPKLLDPVTHVTVSNTSIATEVITASFNAVDDRHAPIKSVAISTITQSELKAVDQTGADAPIVGATETATKGVWTIDVTGSGMTSGTIQLLASATSLYSSDATAVV
jgi:hypothetical protein